MADPIELKLEANVATWQKYVDNLFAALDRKLRPAKRTAIEAKLARYLDTLARNQRALDAYRADPVVPPVTPLDIGPDPIPNHAQHSTSIYECPPDFDAKAFEARYGAPVATIMNRVLTAILRPDLDRYNRLVSKETGYTQAQANRDNAGQQTKQKAVLAYFAGQLSFEQGVLPYLGPTWSAYLGCVDIDAIHDLGAA